MKFSKTFILSLFILLAAPSFADEGRVVMASYWIEEVVEDSTLVKGKSALEIIIDRPTQDCDGKILRFGNDDFEKKLKLDDNCSVMTRVKPGDYAFQFLLSKKHIEIITDTINMKGGFRTKIHLSFRSTEQNIHVRKPVIYLYPEVASTVSLKVNPIGEFTFTYPSYNEGWTVEAKPNGELTHEGNSYNYLFWESSQSSVDLASLSDQGFIIQGANSVSFLEEKLSKLGLNSKEQADFITYWGPLIAKNKEVFVQFMINEQCNQFGILDISPEPDNVARVYIVWTIEVPEKQPEEQELNPLDREGFTVLEWGGIELENVSL